MGKTSKFSFARSGRNKRGEGKTAAEVVRGLPNSSVLVADSTSLSKAERILGATVSIGHLPLPVSVGLNLPLHLKPSLSSLSQSVSKWDERSTTVAAEEDSITLNDPSLIKGPSFAAPNLEERSYTRPDSSTCTRPLHQKVSSSTLHSFYEPHKSPLSISQQTSESSARDMALRKGQQTVAQRLEAAYPDTSKAGEVSRNKINELRKVSVRRKAASIDMAKLFPKPFVPGRALLSPNKFVNSPSMLSETSEYFVPKTTVDSEQQQNYEVGPSDPKVMQGPSASYASFQRICQYKPQDSHKTHVRRPPGGIQHWFDSQAEVLNEDFQPQLHNQPLPELTAELERTKRRSVSDPLRHNPVDVGDLKMDYKVRTTAVRCIPTLVTEEHASDRRLSVMSNHSVQSRRTYDSLRSRMSRLAEANLEETSVLCMSSSEDDDSDVEPPELSDGPSISDTYGPEELHAMPDAQQSNTRPEAFSEQKYNSRHEQPTYILTGPDSRPTSEWSVHFSEPASLEVPKHMLAGKSRSGTKCASKLVASSQLKRSASNISTRKPSQGNLYAFSRTTSQSRSVTPRPRIMAVSEEEEALLEMMRSKRATLKQQLFAEGYEHALKEELDFAHRVPLRNQDVLEMESHHPHSLNADCFPSPPTSLPPSPPFERVDLKAPRTSVRPQTSPEALSQLKVEVGDTNGDYMSSTEVAMHRRGCVQRSSRASPTRRSQLSPVSTLPPLSSEIITSRSPLISQDSESSAPVTSRNSTNNTYDHRHVASEVETQNRVRSQQDNGRRVHNGQCDMADRAYPTHEKDGSKTSSVTSSIVVLDVHNGSGHVRTGTPLKRPLYRQRLDSVKEDVLHAWANLGGLTGFEMDR